jgi:hypothetical protein
MLGALHLQHIDPHGPQVAGESGPVAACAFYPGTPHGAEALRPTQEPLVTLRGRRHARLAQASLPRWSTATATWKSRCVSTPRITSTKVSGLSAPIILTSQAPFDVAVTFTRGAGENGRMCCEGSRHRRRAPMRSRWLRPLVAVGRHQGVRPTSHLQGTFRAHVEGGSGRSETSPTAILQDTHSVEEEFCELRIDGVLRSSGPS